MCGPFFRVGEQRRDATAATATPRGRREIKNAGRCELRLLLAKSVWLRFISVQSVGRPRLGPFHCSPFFIYSHVGLHAVCDAHTSYGLWPALPQSLLLLCLRATLRSFYLPRSSPPIPPQQKQHAGWISRCRYDGLGPYGRIGGENGSR